VSISELGQSLSAVVSKTIASSLSLLFSTSSKEKPHQSAEKVQSVAHTNSTTTTWQSYLDWISIIANRNLY
jgi:hypothetical protein